MPLVSHIAPRRHRRSYHIIGEANCIHLQGSPRIHLGANVTERHNGVFLDYPEGRCSTILRIHQSTRRHVPLDGKLHHLQVSPVALGP